MRLFSLSGPAERERPVEADAGAMRVVMEIVGRMLGPGEGLGVSIFRRIVSRGRLSRDPPSVVS